MVDGFPAAASWFSKELIPEVDEMLRGAVASVTTQHERWAAGVYYRADQTHIREFSVREGDRIRGGFYLNHDPSGETRAGTRLYRLICMNGEIAYIGNQSQVRFDSEAPPYDWREQLQRAIHASFSKAALAAHQRRLRGLDSRPMHSWVSTLATLRAQGRLSNVEWTTIRRSLMTETNPTTYDVLNAVTHAAHFMRGVDRWDRAHELERLGGEIGQGMETPDRTGAALV